MAYITSDEAFSILETSGDTEGVANAQLLTPFVQRASDRIEAIPFKDEAPYPTRPRFTAGVSGTGVTIPNDLALAVARLAVYFLRNPSIGYRAIVPTELGPLGGIPEEVRNALWAYLPDSLKDASANADSREDRRLDLREKELDLRYGGRSDQPALALGYRGDSTSVPGPAPGSLFDRDDIIAGPNIHIEEVGAEQLRISASGTVSATDHVARERADAARTAAEVASKAATAATAATGTNTSNIAANSGRITTNAGNIAELQTEVSTASQSIAGNEARITTAEGKITTLENRPSGDLSAYRTSADQDIIDNRATQGILLARQEARAADGKAVAAQDNIPERVPDAPSAAGKYELNVPASGETSWVEAATGGGGGGGTDSTARARITQEVTDRTNADTALGGRIDANRALIDTNTGNITTLTSGAAALGREVDALNALANSVIPVSHWVRSPDARTLSIAVRWLKAVPTSTRITFNIGGTPAAVTTSEAFRAGELFILSVPVNAASAGNINRETTTAAGYVLVTVTIAGETARGLMQTIDAPSTSGGGSGTTPAPAAASWELVGSATNVRFRPDSSDNYADLLNVTLGDLKQNEIVDLRVYLGTWTVRSTLAVSFTGTSYVQQDANGFLGGEVSTGAFTGPTFLNLYYLHLGTSTSRTFYISANNSGTAGTLSVIRAYARR